MHFVTSSLVMAGLTVAHAAQPAPRITPAPVLVGRQDWQSVRDSALAAASSAEAAANAIAAQFGKRDVCFHLQPLFGVSQ